MRIISVQLCNLASLKGTFTIDLASLFQQTEILLIHGPTGAGKTTILDAISLAIFGQTARNKSNIEEQIMTMGTGSCSASVILELQSSDELEGSAQVQYYRFSISIKRARELSDGKIQPMEYTIELLSRPSFIDPEPKVIFSGRRVKKWRKRGRTDKIAAEW